MEKGGALYLNKFESLSLSNTLCQVWLKLAQWFWRRRWKCEVYRQTDGQTDGQTDDGRQVIRKAHLRFQIRWAKIIPLCDCKEVRAISKYVQYMRVFCKKNIGNNSTFPTKFWKKRTLKKKNKYKVNIDIYFFLCA